MVGAECERLQVSPSRTLDAGVGRRSVIDEDADHESSRDGRFDRRLARSDVQHPLPRAIRRPRNESILQHRSVIVDVYGRQTESVRPRIGGNYGTMRSSCSSGRSD